ncbi:MAG: hypothetical protein ACI8P3_003276 [Saprospiraceae bacterium]|jgi:hypothetical protein
MPLTLGPYFSANYRWQLYPELQSGHMFWFTSLEIGPRLMLILPYKTRKFNIVFTNSFAGLISRPTPPTEKYFYSLTIADFIENAHRDLEFGFNNKFNHTNLEIKALHTKGKKLSLAYEFEYFSYYQNPTLNYLPFFQYEMEIG